MDILPIYWLLIAIASFWLLVFIACLIFVRRAPALSFKNKTVLITGGSEGIGLAVAEECIRRGAFVCVAARREEVLKAAVAKLAKVGAAENRAHYVQMDVGDEKLVSESAKEVAAWVKSVQATVSSKNRAAGDSNAPLLPSSSTTTAAAATAADSATDLSPDIIICNAGYSYPARFTDIPSSHCSGMMNVNFFGCVNVVRAFLPAMVARRSGRVALVSSMAGLFPLAGFSVYSATKAAVKAFASSLDMEWAWSGVRFQVVNPPDVATPGFDAENKVKSPECKKICESSSATPFKSEEVANVICDKMESYSFQVNVGFDGNLLGTLCATTDTASSTWALFFETMFGGLLRLIIAAHTWVYYGWVSEIRAEEEKQRK